MKIQCSCGAKYVIDVVPGMASVQFVCRACGQDYSAYVNELIRTELGKPTAQPMPPQAVQPPPPAQTAETAPPSPEGGRLRISRTHTAEAPPQQQQEPPASKYCQRHRTELTIDNCQVCKKPICPKCVETFGPFCSPFCRNKVEGPSMNAPFHIGGKFSAQRAFWRKTGRISSIVGSILFCLLGFWFWYAWFGSVPRVYFSVRWNDISHSGSSRVVDGNQLLFLHGGTLARYNLQTKQKVWSLELVTQQQIDDVLKAEDEEAEQEQKKYGRVTGEILIGSQRQKYARIGLEQDLSLLGDGQSVWIARDNTVTHYDWNTGNVLQQITLTNNFNGLTEHGDELLAVGTAPDGSQCVTHINMDDGQMHTEEFSGTPAAPVAQRPPPAAGPPQGGLPMSPYEAGRPMNPAKVAQQAQNMTLPGRIALPALIANNEHNEQINREINQEDRQMARAQGVRPPPAAPPQPALSPQDFSLIPDGDSYIAFGSHLLTENIVQREAMRAPPTHSALDSPNLSTANEAQAVNEQLNELQRNNGGDKVSENESTYQIILRRPGNSEPDWVGQVVGPPQFFALKTVNVLAAGKTITVFDKSDKKLWQGDLTYDVTGGDNQADGSDSENPGQSLFGAGPCVENNGTLYVFDQAVLTAYDPSSGNVRWRIPSVGIVGLFFDDKGMVYVNTTTGNPDDIRYSRQIDVTKSTEAVVMKVNPASGAILWKYNPGGYICYVSGKFIYSFRDFDPGDQEDQTSETMAELESPAYLKIIRINPDNGHVMWDHEEGRAPVDVEFDRNMILLVLKKEVEVLRFFTL